MTVPATQTIASAQETLALFLAAEDDGAAQALLERLVQDHADPIIKDVIRRKMGVHIDHVRRLDRVASRAEEGGVLSKPGVELDAEDIHATALLSLIEHLWSIKGADEPQPIADFRGYVGRIALNAFAMHMRQLYPERHRLRRKLWYLAQGRTSASGFAQWQGRNAGDQVFGFQEWDGKPVRVTSNYQRWQQDPWEFHKAQPERDPRRVPFAKLVAAVLNWVGGPMDSDDLLVGLAELLGIREVELVYE